MQCTVSQSWSVFRGDQTLFKAQGPNQPIASPNRLPTSPTSTLAKCSTAGPIGDTRLPCSPPLLHVSWTPCLSHAAARRCPAMSTTPRSPSLPFLSLSPSLPLLHGHCRHGEPPGRAELLPRALLPLLLLCAALWPPTPLPHVALSLALLLLSLAATPTMDGQASSWRRCCALLCVPPRAPSPLPSCVVAGAPLLFA